MVELAGQLEATGRAQAHQHGGGQSLRAHLAVITGRVRQQQPGGDHDHREHERPGQLVGRGQEPGRAHGQVGRERPGRADQQAAGGDHQPDPAEPRCGAGVRLDERDRGTDRPDHVQGEDEDRPDRADAQAGKVTEGEQVLSGVVGVEQRLGDQTLLGDAEAQRQTEQARPPETPATDHLADQHRRAAVEQHEKGQRGELLPDALLAQVLVAEQVLRRHRRGEGQHEHRSDALHDHGLIVASSAVAGE
ncbi:hypothetical protein [Microlunatus kandeliicorticis]|uniref:hypothetical protein n=1 Tax=Microlunatus kandeliicorticis TaxID=1759536 RepID=UPI0015FDB481|nr:hypothetical protein [Microlunatus kandeliicorticis]